MEMGKEEDKWGGVSAIKETIEEERAWANGKFSELPSVFPTSWLLSLGVLGSWSL